MLILSRRLGEKIQISEKIVIEIVEICRDNRVRLGISAPKEIGIYRTELLPLANQSMDDNKV